MNEPVQNFRKKELQAIYRFIDNAYIDEIANIVNEISVCHGLYVFNKKHKSVDKVQQICVNGETIQLNVEVDDE